MLVERVVSRKKAIFIISSLIVALAASCIVVGFKAYAVIDARRPQLEKDEIALEKSIRKNPTDLRLHLNLGQVYYLQNKKKNALREYRKSLAIDNKCVEAIYYIGLIALDEKDYKEAEKQMKKALEIAPRHKQAALALAHIYRDSKQSDKAVAQYRSLLKTYSGAADIAAELGMVFEEQGKRLDAIKQYREALYYVPEYKPALDGLARLGNS